MDAKIADLVADLGRKIEHKLDIMGLIGPNTIYPAEYYRKRRQPAKLRCDAHIARALETHFAPNSVIDFGCGIGGLLSYFERKGVEIRGVDGHDAAREHCIISRSDLDIRDLRQPFDAGRRFDLAVAIELVEHIPSRYADTLVRSIVSSASDVVLTAARPGQGGRHHVNERGATYWSDKFGMEGYVRDESSEETLRELFDQHVPAFYADNLLVFSDADDGL